MDYLPTGYYLEELKKKDIKELLNTFILNVYEHFNFNYTKEDFTEELRTLYSEDIEYFDNSIYYVLRDSERNNIHASIRVTLWDKNCCLPIEKLFGIKLQQSPFIATKNVWHIGRFFISNKIADSRIRFLKKMLFNAFYPVAIIKNSILFAECDAKLVYTLQNFGITVKILGNSVRYICSDTIPISIDNDTLISFINKNYVYFREENKHNIEYFSKKIKLL